MMIIEINVNIEDQDKVDQTLTITNHPKDVVDNDHALNNTPLTTTVVNVATENQDTQDQDQDLTPILIHTKEEDLNAEVKINKI